MNRWRDTGEGILMCADRGESPPIPLGYEPHPTNPRVAIAILKDCSNRATKKCSGCSYNTVLVCSVNNKVTNRRLCLTCDSDSSKAVELLKNRKTFK
jgi:hypothetical protein